MNEVGIISPINLDPLYDEGVEMFYSFPKFNIQFRKTVTI